MDAGSDRSVCWRCLSDLLMDTVHTEIFDVEKPFFCLCSSLFFLYLLGKSKSWNSGIFRCRISDNTLYFLDNFSFIFL
jgi:hypothetical protein